MWSAAPWPLPVSGPSRPHHMARKPSVGELLLGGLVVALLSFVGSQVIASPRRAGKSRGPVLSGRDSAAIAVQYRNEIAARRGADDVPAWLQAIEIARLESAAQRDIDGRDSVRTVSPDSVRAIFAGAEGGTYLATMLAEDDGVVTRWRESSGPIRVWVEPRSSAVGFSPEDVGSARRAFTAWNEVGLPVSFAIVEDSTEADVHVTWTDHLPAKTQIGTTFRMTAGRGWIAFAQVVLVTTYDIYAVQNAARHEAGHVLGLGHSPSMADIMAAETEGRQYQLTSADRATALALYALPPGKAR